MTNIDLAGYDGWVPRELTGDQDRLIRAVERAHAKMRRAEDDRAAARDERAKAISNAKAAGLPMTAIAERLGVSLERVRQMEAAR